MCPIPSSASWIVSYVGAILIASNCEEEQHLRHLDEVFRRQDDCGLLVNAEKLRVEINGLQFPPGIDYAEISTDQQREGISSYGIPSLATLPFGENTQIVCD